MKRFPRLMTMIAATTGASTGRSEPRTLVALVATLVARDVSPVVIASIFNLPSVPHEVRYYMHDGPYEPQYASKAETVGEEGTHDLDKIGEVIPSKEPISHWRRTVL